MVKLKDLGDILNDNKQQILERSRSTIVKAISKELEYIREPSKTDAGELFKYQTLLYNFLHKIEKREY